MIFTKQDQIQCTLHGETRHVQSQPVMTSPPFTSPAPSSSGFNTIGQAQQSSRAESLAAGTDYSSVLEQSDLESIFGLDWLVPSEPQTATQDTAPAGQQFQGPETPMLEGSLHCMFETSQLVQLADASEQPTLATTPQQQPTLAGTLQQQPTLAGTPQQPTLHRTPQQQPTLAGTPQQQPMLHRTPQQQPMLAGTPQQQPTLHRTPQQQPTLAGTPQQQPMLHRTPQQQPTLAGTPQQQPMLHQTPQQQPTLAGTPQPSALAGASQPDTPMGHVTRQGRKRFSSSLVNAADVLDHNTLYSIKDVGKLGRALAAQSFFGDSVLRVSTPRGDSKRGLQPLDPEKLHSLVNAIHHHPSFTSLSVTDFQELVGKKILPSIAHYCKKLRTRYSKETLVSPPSARLM